MRTPREHLARPLLIFALSSAIVPVFVILALLGYAVLAWAELGHWPSYANPDPKQLGWWLQHSALQLGFAAFPVTSLVAICLAIVGRIRERDFPFWTVVVVTVVSIALLVIYGRLDPGGLVAWFWD